MSGAQQQLSEPAAWSTPTYEELQKSNPSPSKKEKVKTLNY